MRTDGATEVQQNWLLPLIFDNRFNFGKLDEAINAEQVFTNIAQCHYLKHHFINIFDKVFPNWKDLEDWTDLKRIYHDIALPDFSIFITQQVIRRHKNANFNLCLYDIIPFLNAALSSYVGKLL